MKLMGAPRLFEIGGTSVVARGACAALRAELEAAAWRSRAEVSAAFSRATWESDQLIIALDEELCAAIAFNYESGIALIEFAGRRLDYKNTPQKRRRIRP
jgi:hypothetical protein